MKHLFLVLTFLLMPAIGMAQEKPAKTIVEDEAEAALLLGRHLFTSSNLQNTALGSFAVEFGDAVISNNDGVYTIKADHTCYSRIPRYPKYIEGGFIRIIGNITKIEKDTFTVDGTFDALDDYNFSKDDDRMEKCNIKTQIVFTREVDPESEDTDFEEHWRVQNTSHLWKACHEQTLYFAKIYTKQHEGPAPISGCARTLEDAAHLPME